MRRFTIHARLNSQFHFPAKWRSSAIRVSKRRSHREDFLADVMVADQVKIMSLHPLKEGAVVGMEVVASSIQDAAQRLTAVHSRLKTEHETLHDSCQTQLSASLFCKMAKFSHSSFKEKVTSRRFSRRCYGGRSSQDHVAPPLKGRCSGGDGGGCLEHPGCGPTSYSYSFSSKD